ncbi:hypothetical protein [Brachyspira hampsonii]|uniref:hypothetical protein n=1 Tax=Brachyspira hampsonii TaxID=1287055 RepID=UPI000D3A4E78|nr:hypothetical protein [Brachyspira hampsonii]PTY39485.1 hypothetical protein DQ06_02315 [Brachyspira hampsonii bv. II]
MFRLIKEPEETPSNLLDSYRQQNIIMQKMRMLHTAFDGIKLNHWGDTDRELPDILSGSICEFEGRLFETNENIKLIDNITDIRQDLRFIKLVIVRDSNNKDNDYLRAEIAGGYSETVGNGFPSYDYENRGFYKLDSQGRCLEKYLRLSMKYNTALGGYVEKKYWNINDFERKGKTLKRKTVSFGVGTHEFDFPSDVNSITVHICSGGAGGYYGLLDTVGTEPTVGGNSQVLVGNTAITTCQGGQIAVKTGTMSLNGGNGGIAIGQGKLINGNNGSTSTYNNINYNTGAVFTNNTTLASGGNGGNGSINGYASGGGGSGSAAIVDVTRGMLGSLNKVKIIVGAGGNGGVNSNNNGVVANGERGQDGSAVIEYMQK